MGLSTIQCLMEGTDSDNGVLTVSKPHKAEP